MYPLLISLIKASEACAVVLALMVVPSCQKMKRRKGTLSASLECVAWTLIRVT
jgi:hypothetical protein